MAHLQLKRILEVLLEEEEGGRGHHHWNWHSPSSVCLRSSLPADGALIMACAILLLCYYYRV